jgi:hypothetical protein
MFARTCIGAGLLFLITAICRFAYAQAEELPPSLAPVAPAPAPVDPPPSAAEAQPTRDREHGLVLVPSLGMNVPVGRLTDGYTQGFHLGALVGWHLNPTFSLNGGLGFDLMNSNWDSSIFDPHEYYFDVSLSPLVHFHSDAIFIGPQIGWFENNRSQSSGQGSNLFSGGQRSALPGSSSVSPPPTLVKHSGHGVLLGVTLGVFTPVGKRALGLVASGGYRRFITASCAGTACAADQLGGVAHMDISLAALY